MGAYGPVTAFTHLCIFVAFLLLLLVTLSTPIIHSISLMRANVQVGSSFLSAHEFITFGVFGYCLSSAKVDVFGLKPSINGACTKPALGYSTQFSNDSHIKNLLHSSIAKGLVIFPVAAALALVALIASVASYLHTHARGANTYLDTRPRSRSSTLLSIIALTSLILANIFATLCFIIAIVVDAKAHAAASDSHGIVSVSYTNGVWMALAAAILLWFAMFGLCCAGVMERRRRSARAAKY